uniref:HMG box domain-containing protein n=2 Tax=Hordeum vulgare subsp. vulgare TaxID=112509 RepID=A0A8I7BH75_HORVV
MRLAVLRNANPPCAHAFPQPRNGKHSAHASQRLHPPNPHRCPLSPVSRTPTRPRGPAPHNGSPQSQQTQHQQPQPFPPTLPNQSAPLLRSAPPQNPSSVPSAASTMKGKADASKKGEGRLKAAGGASKRKKAAAAAGKPKRPPSAFFVFMSDFRQQYNAENPNNKNVANVSKAAGEKWRSMSDEDKAPYVEKAGQKKQDYEKTKASFENKESVSSKKAKTQDDEEAEGSKSEVEDEGSDEDNEDDDE